jgi:hypothetical protein
MVLFAADRPGHRHVYPESLREPEVPFDNVDPNRASK